MSAVETVGRMLALVPWLLERPGASVDEAAAAFGVDRATILRDLDTIGYCGMPGLGGGDLFEVSVVEGRVLVEMAHGVDQPLRLAPREALRLVLAGEMVAAAFGEELPGLRSALDKVRSAAGIAPEVSVDLVADGVRWLAPLREAVREGRQVLMSYRGRADHQPQERTVDPWRLHVAEGAWYVQGRDHRAGEVRTFRLDRIAALTVTDEPAAAPDHDAPLPPPRYEPGPDDTEVELLVPAEDGWIADAVRVERREDLADGRRRVVFHTDALPWVARLLLAAGSVEIVRPPELAETVRAEAEEALSRYDRSS